MKYSILIPTRNGASYLPYAVESVLSQPYEDCELLVSVNHSTDNSLEILKKINDPRLKILIPPKPLSMSGHYEWLLKHAIGDWVTIVGDDDGVMPYFFKRLDSILQKWPKILAITCRSAHYFWEGYHDDVSSKILDYESTPIERIYSSKWSLLQILAGIKNWDFLPKLYTNGVIHSSVIQEILNKSNHKFFYEQTPDVYSTVAIATTTSRFLRIETPLFWTGSSPKSVGYSFAKKINKESSLRADEFIKMSKTDHVTLAPCINMEMWEQAFSQVYCYSALCALPFPLKRFKNKGITYLVFGSIYSKVMQGNQTLQTIYRQQIDSLHLKFFILRCIPFLLQVLRMLTKPLERYNYLIKLRKHKKNRVSISSNDYKKVPNLCAASQFISQK